ncbi:MAG: DUF4091 domain-containing protein [Clostridia bacterium]|nr:DUF4091 domain-containing protein [Clostridia bacterium]
MKKTKKWLTSVFACFMASVTALGTGCQLFGGATSSSSESSKAEESSNVSNVDSSSDFQWEWEGGEDSSSESVEEEKLETAVWAAYGSEKFLREYNYSSRYDSDTMKIAAFRNDMEGGQIVISAGEDGEYTVKTSDLKTASGDVLKKEDIGVYHAKFITLTEIWDKGVPTGAGDYTDALVPYENIVAYGENKVTKGSNQPIYFEVQPSENQPAGTYTGTFEVTFAGKKYNVPVEIVVYDYTLSETTHLKVSFQAKHEEYQYGELDGTVEMAQKYNDFFLDHRIGLGGNVKDILGDYNMNYPIYLEDYVAAAKDPRVALIRIPTTQSNDAVNEETSVTLNKTQFSQWVMEIAMLCLDENMDLLEKGYTYMNWCDEYERQENGAAKVYNSFTAMKEVCDELAQWVTSGKSKTVSGKSYAFKKPSSMSQEDFNALKAEVADSILNITHMLTCTSLVSLNSYCEMKGYETPTVTPIPLIDKFTSEAARKEYTDYIEEFGGEFWTYTTINPSAPYPTYHMEDQAVSARAMGWMLYEYGFDGYLFWSSTFYSYIDVKDKNENYVYQVQDFYQEPIRYPGMNGEGWLTYPGRPYGVDGPVASIRLKAIGDCNEDYDLFYELEEFYKERGASEADFDSVFKYMSQGIYYAGDVRIDYNGDPVGALHENRKKLAGALELASHAGVIVESIDKNANDVTVRISAPEGQAVKFNGKTLSGGTTNDGVIVYEEKLTLKGDNTAVAVETTKDGKTYSMALDLGVEAKTLKTAQLNGKISGNTSSTKVTVTTEKKDGVDLLKVDAKNSSGVPSVKFNLSDLSVTAPYNYITVKVYNYGEATEMIIRGKAKKNNLYNELVTLELTEGWNELQIPLTALLMAVNGDAEAIRFDTTGDMSLGFGEFLLEE